MRRRAEEHIASEGEAYEKCTTAAPTRPEPRCAHNLLESTRPLQKERTKIGSAPTKRGGPSQGFERKEGEREIDVIPIAKKRMILDILRNQLELDNC